MFLIMGGWRWLGNDESGLFLGGYMELLLVLLLSLILGFNKSIFFYEELVVVIKGFDKLNMLG